MPSIDQSKKQVKASLDKQSNEVDHDAILAGLQDEIDRHNNIKHNLEHSIRRNRRQNELDGSRSQHASSAKFRFKEGVSKPSNRKHRSRNDASGRKHKSHRSNTPEQASLEPSEEAAHPFPRESAGQVHSSIDAQAAFRESLFDALADDEGALYWEGVYSQPIHIYERPSLKNENGELEQMDDNEYAAYVQSRMWERKHPEIVQERQARERARKTEREEREQRRAEFVRRKERAAWERARGWVSDGEDEDDSQSRRNGKDRHEFASDVNSASEREGKVARYAAAWSAYLLAWDKLKHDVLAQPDNKDRSFSSNDMPWPTAIGKPVNKANTEDFMRNAPRDQAHPLSSILKRERVRWHPDKVQQLFAGHIDDDTMKRVTSVFQVIDELYEKERARNAG